MIFLLDSQGVSLPSDRIVIHVTDKAANRQFNIITGIHKSVDILDMGAMELSSESDDWEGKVV